MQFAWLYPRLYPVLAASFPLGLWAGNPDRREIALSFDDGPHPEYTPALLRLLDQEQVTASFFWLGCWVDRAPAVAKQVWDAGHWLGLHGYHHRSFPRLSADELQRDLKRTQRAIAQACQLDPAWVQHHVRDVRPPNGLFLPGALAQWRSWGYRPVMWSVVPEDWTHPGPTVVQRRVLDQVQNGSLIVLHDGPCGGRDVVKTVAQLIPALRDRGWRFVTVDRLWDSIEQDTLNPASPKPTVHEIDRAIDQMPKQMPKQMPNE